MAFDDIIKNTPVALAPMAGCADRAFRELCIEQGADFCVGELCSSKGVYMDDRKSKTLLFVDDKERPMATQIFGSEPGIMAAAAKTAAGFSPDFIDINMGCPAPKVISSGGGSALMRDPQLAGEVVRAVKDAVELPVTVKMRIGWDDAHKNAVEFAKLLEQSGADMLTVHGRTREQMYSGRCDYGAIAAVKKAVKIPVIANGDIKSGRDAAEMLEKTGCDGVMIGRAALGNPFIFKSVKAYLNKREQLPEPPLEQKLDMLVRQCRLMAQYKDPHNAVLESRKHAAWYLKGIKNAASYRRACGEISSIDDILRLCETVLKDAARADG